MYQQQQEDRRKGMGRNGASIRGGGAVEEGRRVSLNGAPYSEAFHNGAADESSDASAGDVLGAWDTGCNAGDIFGEMLTRAYCPSC